MKRLILGLLLSISLMPLASAQYIGQIGQGTGGGAASNVTVGTSSIAGGTNLRVLYDNAGVLGEYTNAQLTALINPATAALSGALPAWPNNTTTFFRGDGTYTGVGTAALTGLGTGVATALGVNVGSAGAFVTFNGALGTPSSGVATNLTGLPVSTGISGFGTGVATALAVNVGSAGAFTTFNGAGGTPSSITLTNGTGLPISTGVSGLATGIATFLATPSSANLAAAITNETGSGFLVFSDTPTFTGTVFLPNSSRFNGTGLGLGRTPSFPFDVHIITDVNLVITNSSTAVSIGAINDANNVLVPLLIQTGGLSISGIISSSAAQSGTLCFATSGNTISYDPTVGCLASTARVKHDIQPLMASDAEVMVMKLRPTSFVRNETEVSQIGLIAEDVAEVDERLVARDSEGLPRGYSEQGIIALLVGALQQQQARIEALERGR